jgi:hypothetical protein
MKQRKLVQKVYRACFDHDAERLAQLRKKEFAKIQKRRAEGKPFNTRWTLVRI